MDHMDFSIPNDSSSPITNLTSGYTRLQASALPVNSIRRQTTSPGLLTNYPMGSFAEDYVFSETVGGLDTENGRYGVTPEYPEGVYAYFTTIDRSDRKNGFPFFVGPNLKEKYIMTLIF